jgi:hypothetical protein
MEIERGAARRNEYKDRPVLPLAVQVTGEILTDGATATTPAAEVTQTLTQQTAPQIPVVGDIFTGVITKLDASAAVIAVPDYNAEQALALMDASVADLRRYRVGNSARVEVVETKQQRSGRVLLIVKPAPRLPGGKNTSDTAAR